MSHACLQDEHTVMVGVMGACADGNGFKAKFENFSIEHLADKRLIEWLKNNAEE